MAIKASNKITIIEQKKIKEIKEWYLATNQDSGVTRATDGWTSTVQNITESNKYLWNYEEVVYSIGSSDVSEPVIIGAYGGSGSSLQVKYISSQTTPVIMNNDVSAWSDTIPAPVSGENIYMIQKMSYDTEWSIPIRISADDGAHVNVKIVDGYWYINDEPTGIKAEGEDGKTPTITIGEDGYWYIDGVKTGTRAEGEAGKDGASIEYVYYRCTGVQAPKKPYYEGENLLPTGWNHSPQGITENNKYEYVSIRTKEAGSESWGDFSNPVVWSKWGEKGQDGDGVYYEYYLSNSNEIPAYSAGDPKWTDEPQGVSKDDQYEYVVQIKTNGDTVTISTPSLWAKYGVDGLSITDVKNYYLTTLVPEFPENPEWKDNAPLLSPENRYLWNYEKIIYNDDSSTSTEPAIIGVYVDAGTSTVDFQIYSVDGFQFSENVNSITLKTAAFYGGNAIESGATYQWKYWNTNSTLEDKYENITDATSSSLVVDDTDSYAFSSLKCEMTYDGITYSDFVTLTKNDIVYTSIIKFMGGSNIFDPSLPYLLAYVELYKGQRLEDTIQADKFYNGNNTINSDVITSDFIDDDSEPNMMYFLAQCDHSTTGDDHYIAVLGKFVEWIYDDEDTSLKVGSTWNVIDNVDSKYTYVNNIYKDVQSNVIVISKEDVSTTKEINIEVYETHDINEDDIGQVQRTLLSTTSATVVDLNDPIIGDTEPTNVKYGQLWLDTSVSPYILKIYTKLNNSYVLGEGSSVLVLYSQSISGGSANEEKKITYGDNIIVSDDGTIKLANGLSVTFSFNTYTNANILIGKFFYYGQSFYYLPDDGVSNISRSTNYLKNAWSVYVDNAQKIVDVVNNTGEWQYFSQQNGGVVYTSIPLDGYSEGDLWIISNEDISLHSGTYTELFDKFGAGTMLKASASSSSFNHNHWDDAQSESTSIINNVKQYFEFNGDDGLKIGRKDESFYVNISAEKMSFYDNTGDNPAEVVYISNSTANIDNLLIEGSAEFDCNATFNGSINMNGKTSNQESVGFIWKIEANGSLSLALSS